MAYASVDKLQNMLAERKRLENELLEIAENERRRIGFDLHDDLGQKLTGLSMMIKGLQRKLSLQRRPEAPEALKIHSLIDQIIHHTHDLAHNFSSLDVRGDDLSSVLKQLAGNVKNMFGIACGCTVKGKIPELYNDTTVQLYKIAQEAVSNAIKHGKATQVAIGLANSSNKLLLTIKNNGVAFSGQASADNRMGLRIMNYRANTIGAVLEIKAVNNSGTLVICALPLKNGSRVNRRSLAKRGGRPFARSGGTVQSRGDQLSVVLLS